MKVEIDFMLDDTRYSARATCACLMVSMCPGLEQQFDIATQMIDAGRSDVGSAFGFREDESTL